MDEAAPYSALAAGYDAVMAHVDYERWAQHAHRLLRRHHPAARDLLELGCGTGALALALQPLGPYRYTATDGSEAMLTAARAKAAGTPIRFRQADFRVLPADLDRADAVLLLYDGLNYLREEAEVAALFAGVHALLRPGGLFLFDQSTPANSLNHPDGFDDAGDAGPFRYLRTSRYDALARLHTTTFRLHLSSGRALTETHVQRAYTRAEVEALLAASPLRPVAAYAGFSFRPATDATERIHWIAQRPAGGEA